MKRIAVISDIHGNMPALERVAEDIKMRDVDGVFNLGDHLSGPLWPKETAEFLSNQDWIQILGNHDRRLISVDTEFLGASDAFARELLDEKDLDWLWSLPEDYRTDDGILLFHGTPTDDTVYLLETIKQGEAVLASHAEIEERLCGAESAVLLCGHTHIPRIVAMPDDILLVNPGSVGLPAYDDIVPEPHVMETGSPHARYAVLEKTGNAWDVHLIALSYDFEKAAEQAGKNGRRDWKVGLRTGFMRG